MATIATEAPAVYTEEGRHQKKRNELKKKLEARRKKEALAAGGVKNIQEVTAEEAQKAAKIAKDAAAAIEAAQEQKGQEKEAPRAKVKIGGRSHVTTEIPLNKNDQARIQAKCAAGHAAKIKAIVKTKNITEVYDASNLPDDHVLVFTECVGCDFLVASHVVKIFVEKCTKCTFRFEGRIITAVVEIDRCEECNVLIGTPVGTLQIEQCKRMNVVFAQKALLIGYIIWAGCFTLRVQVGDDDLMRCDFELTKGFDPTTNVERTQFYNSL